MMMIACENKPDGPKTVLKDSIIESHSVISLKDQIRRYPDSARLYDKLIDQYVDEKNYLKATAWCDTLLQRDRDKNFSYWFVKGDIQRQSLQHDSAIYSYQQYLQRFPDDDQVLLNLANTMAEAGKIESLNISDGLMKRSPTREMRADCFFIKGVYYSRTKQFDQAIENFDQAITNQYSFWEAYIEKSITFYDQQKYDKSLETLAKLQQANQAYPDAYYWIGKCEEALNKREEAIKNYEAAYGLDKTFIEAKEKIDSFSNIK